jgi:hypothetical protein
MYRKYGYMFVNISLHKISSRDTIPLKKETVDILYETLLWDT